MAKAQTPASQNPPASKAEVPEGFTVMYTPEGCTGCSFDGTEYEASEGTVTVPVEAVSQLLGHGFATHPKESK